MSRGLYEFSFLHRKFPFLWRDPEVLGGKVVQLKKNVEKEP
jgi:hypothetical protein